MVGGGLDGVDHAALVGVVDGEVVLEADHDEPGNDAEEEGGADEGAEDLEADDEGVGGGGVVDEEEEFGDVDPVVLDEEGEEGEEGGEDVVEVEVLVLGTEGQAGLGGVVVDGEVVDESAEEDAADVGVEEEDQGEEHAHVDHEGPGVADQNHRLADDPVFEDDVGEEGQELGEAEQRKNDEENVVALFGGLIGAGGEEGEDESAGSHEGAHRDPENAHGVVEVSDFVAGEVDAEEGVDGGEEAEDDGVEVPVVVEVGDVDVEDEDGVGADEEVDEGGQQLVKGRVEDDLEGGVVPGVVWLGNSRSPDRPVCWSGPRMPPGAGPTRTC